MLRSAPPRHLRPEKVLDLGGVRVRLLWLGPGHTRGDTVAFVEGDRVFFSGDLAMQDLFPAFASPQSNSRTWLTSLDQMAALQATQLVPAHYPLTDSTAIDGYRRYLTALQARVAALKQQGNVCRNAALLVDEFKHRIPPGISRGASRLPWRCVQGAPLMRRDACTPGVCSLPSDAHTCGVQDDGSTRGRGLTATGLPRH